MILGLLLLLLGTPGQAAACGAPCGADLDCARVRAACLGEAGDHRGAVEALKPARAAHPDDGPLARQLAAAYLALGNVPWATRTLLDHLERVPEDGDTRAWAGWVLLQDGDPDRARQVLEATSEAGNPRLCLVAAALEEVAGQPDRARARLEDVSASGAALAAEDRVLYANMRRRLLGDPGTPLSAWVEVGTGYTTNAVQSAPQDVGAGGAEVVGAPLGQADAVLRWEPWTSPHLRPRGELRGRGLLPGTEVARSYGWVDGGARLGVEVGSTDGVRTRLAWSGELLGVNGGDAWSPADRRWYMEAHRGELEVDLGDRAQVFAGGGRRIYRDLARTRTEVDGGAAWVQPLPGGWNVTGILAARWQDGRVEAWDAWGGTGLLRVVAPLPRGASVRTVGMLVLDDYPRSGEWYGGDPRRDRLAKVETGPWTGPWRGIRVGLTWTSAFRESTVADYTYQDHRVLLELRWNAAWNPSAPPRVPGDAGAVAAPWGGGAAGEGDLERVQDLLRQEDSARRGSSCVD